MTSLQIGNNKSQPSSNAVNLQGNTPATSMAMDAGYAEPFALLLAQQIGETSLSVPDAAQTGIVIDGSATGSTDRALKDKQDQATVVANNPGDPANILAAIMQQLPAPVDKGQNTDGMQATQPFAIAPFQRTENLQAMQPFASGSSQPEDRQTIQISTLDLPSEAIKRAELPSGASPAIPAAIPGMLASNIPTNSPLTINTPLGNNGWADDFSQKISWISTQQNQVAELHLNPPNLGPLDVTLKISDNQATILFTSPHGAVRDAVENALPKLREILADNGIMLGNTTISDQPPRDRSMDEFMNQGSGTAVRHEVFGMGPETAGLAPASMQTAPVRRHNGMVDTFA